MSSKKWWAFFGAGALAVAASIATLFPQTSPLSAPVKVLAQEAQKAAENIPDPCPAGVCDRGQPRGTVMPLDGGVRGICECP